MSKFEFTSLPDTPVEITSVKDLFTYEQYWLTYPLIYIHECHNNAFQVASHLQSDTPIEIVEGYLEESNGTRIPHAFNKIGDKYFDFTLEKFSPEFNKQTYLAKRIYTRSSMLSVIGKMGGTCITFNGLYKKKYKYFINDEGELVKEPLPKV